MGKARLVGFRGDGERVAPQVGPDATGVRKRKGGKERGKATKKSRIYFAAFMRITRGGSLFI